MPRDAPPGQEHAQRRRSQVGRHADEVAHEADLGLADLGNGVAEVVIGRHREDLDPFAVGHRTQLAAARRRPVERIAVRPLAVDLDSVVADTSWPGVIISGRGSASPRYQSPR